MGTTVGENIVVGLVYSLYDSEGSLLEERPSNDPLYYIHGTGQLLPAVETAINGKNVGFKASIEVESKDGYGEYDPSLLAKVEKSKFPKDLEIEMGMKFDTQGPNGEMTIVEVVEMDDKTITVDGNHPLAGIDLRFELEIHSLRNATSEEIEHGHAHGPDGVGHLH